MLVRRGRVSTGEAVRIFCGAGFSPGSPISDVDKLAARQ